MRSETAESTDSTSEAVVAAGLIEQLPSSLAHQRIVSGQKMKGCKIKYNASEDISKRKFILERVSRDKRPPKLNSRKRAFAPLNARLGRIGNVYRDEPNEPPNLVLYLVRVRCCVFDTIQYQGGPAGFSLSNDPY